MFKTQAYMCTSQSEEIQPRKRLSRINHCNIQLYAHKKNDEYEKKRTMKQIVISFTEVSLRDQYLDINVVDLNSILHKINSGAIQGSILGPIFNAIYVDPLFDSMELSNFADDDLSLSFYENKLDACTHGSQIKIGNKIAYRLRCKSK